MPRSRGSHKREGSRYFKSMLTSQSARESSYLPDEYALRHGYLRIPQTSRESID